jgi:hypothetical protein
MSTTDTMTPLVSAPWFDADGNPLPVRALPGLRPEVIQGLECSYPGIIHPTLRALLETCCRLAATELGSVDFTGCWFPEELCPVFRPCLTLAVDDAGRRWIAEIGDKGVMPSRGVPMRSTNRRSRSAVGLLGYHSMPMCMTYALQRSRAAGRTGSWGRPVDCIAVDDCRSLRSPGHTRKAGAKSSVRRFLPGRRGHPLIAPIAALWTYGHAHERDAKKAPWRRDLRGRRCYEPLEFLFGVRK